MRHWAVWFLSIALCLSADEAFPDHIQPASSQMPPEANASSLFSPLAGPGDYLPVFINVNQTLSPSARDVIEDTVYMQVLMITSVGVLAMLPEGVTNWNRDKLRQQPLSERWFENVSRVPVWDNDDWKINYIGHPVAGAFYYTMARNDGMSIAGSAVFSALMSTFFWEYGYEAVAERPSIQDLFVTPLIGSILGEGMHFLQGKLDSRGGVLWGSRTMGNVGYFLLDPLGNIAGGIKELLQYANIAPEVTMTIHTYPYAGMTMPHAQTGTAEGAASFAGSGLGVIITFRETPKDAKLPQKTNP